LDGITSTLVSNWNSVYSWYTGITATDTDNIINKWQEIIAFLDGISSSSDLNAIVSGINTSISNEVTRAKDSESVNASNITTLQGYFSGGSAKTATKLLTVRSLWGNSFDGTDDVSGNITMKPDDGTYIQIGGARIVYDKANSALYVVGSDGKTSANFYATGGLTAYGAGSGTPSAGTSYNRLDKWSDYTTDKATYILSALLGDDLNTRLSAVESSALTSVDWSIITGKPSTYTPAPHTHSFQSLTGIPTTLAGYGITDANISGGVITLGANSITPLTQHQSLAHTHTLAIGNTRKSVSLNGSQSWSLSEIGAAAISHTHSAADIANGVLAVSVGGTGATSLGTAITNAINALSIGTSTPVDTDYYVCQYANGGTTNTTYYRRPMSCLYAYLKGKLDSVYQPTGSYLTAHQSLSAYSTTIQMTAAISSAVDALTVASAGGSGSYIQSILETDGKISAVAATLPTKLSQFTNDPGFITSSASITGNANTSTYPFGFGGSASSWTWGNLTTANGYSQIREWSDGLGGDIAFADNGSGELSVQTDGTFWQREGQYMCLDSGNYSSYALPLSGGKMTGNLDTVQNGGSWVHAMQFNAIMYNGLGGGTGYNSWEAFLGIKTNSGNIVSYGSIYDQVGFTLYLNGRTDNGTDGYTYLDTTTGIWHFDHSISGNISGNAATASQLLNNYGAHMTFNWIGESGQPSWLWGGEDGSNMYVWNPSNFNVNSAVKLATTRSLWGQNFDGTGNVDGLLSIRNAGGGNYNENVRLHASTGDSWTSLTFCGTDNTGDSGTSLSTWLIGTYQSNIYINRNGSNYHTGCELCNVGGNWGIGTITPSYKLDVAGPGRFQGDLVIGNTIIHASGSNGGINSIQPADDYIIGDCNIGGTMGLKSLNTASAGIGFYGNDGTSNGTLTALSGTLTWTGTICATGGVTAYTTSDRRLKKNIKSIDSLSVIRSLGGTYQFDYRKDNRHSIGFIAQNVRKSELSDIVGELDGYLRINYLDTRLISLALGASVELDDEVTRLKKRVSELEQEVKQLKAA
jgi:hypothetical protein